MTNGYTKRFQTLQSCSVYHNGDLINFNESDDQNLKSWLFDRGYPWLFLSVVICGYSWLFVYLWLFVVIRSYMWLFVVIRVFLVIRDYMWLFMVICVFVVTFGYSWLTVYLWLLVVIRGYSWLYVVIRGYTWLFVVVPVFVVTSQRAPDVSMTLFSGHDVVSTKKQRLNPDVFSTNRKTTSI